MYVEDSKFNDIFSMNLERLQELGRMPVELRNMQEWTYLAGVCDAFKLINLIKTEETKDES